MHWDEYQEKAADTAVYPQAGTRSMLAILYTALGLAGEAGEVANQVKKIFRDDEGVVRPDRIARIRQELGGTFWYLAQLMNELEIEGEGVLWDNLAELQQRWYKQTICGDGEGSERKSPERGCH
jgi:NTP pyrophosphatase (non-canonical NTP hydrolase)